MNEERLQPLHETCSIAGKRRNLVTAISASLAAAAGGNAVAQDQQTGEAAGALEEVTVTARKREESLVDRASMLTLSVPEMAMAPRDIFGS